MIDDICAGCEIKQVIFRSLIEYLFSYTDNTPKVNMLGVLTWHDYPLPQCEHILKSCGVYYCCNEKAIIRKALNK